MKTKKWFLLLSAVFTVALAVGCAQTPNEFAEFPVSRNNNRSRNQDENQRREARAEAQAQAMALAQEVTVTQAAAMSNKTWVKVTGNITLSLGRKYYTFRDSTGEITIEVEQKVWQGLSVTPDERIEITGKVEHKKNGDTQLEVKSIRKI